MRPLWSTLYIDALWRLCSPLILLLYLYWLSRVWTARHSLPGATIVIALFPLAFLVILQVSPDKIIRYELPVVLAFTTMLGALAPLARG